MQFSVPQFIDIEDKIIGPLTLKQFLYFLGAGGLIFLFYTFLTTPFLIVASIPIVGIALLLSFYKPNGRPFIVFLGAIMKYMTRPRLYLWKRTAENREVKEIVPPRKEQKAPKMLGEEVTESRLKRLAWVLDTSGGLEERQAIAENIRSAIPAAYEAHGAQVPAPSGSALSNQERVPDTDDEQAP